MKIDVFQGGVIAHTPYGERLLSRPPSHALRALMDIKPKLCNEVSGRLTCGNTPLNFNGTLAMGICADEIAHLYKIHGMCPPEVVACPYEIITNVPLLYYDGAIGDYQSTPHRASQVLVKYACGIPVGLVTQGELCGVVAELMDGVSPHEGLSITNIWSDARLTEEVPYLPYMHIYNEDPQTHLLEDQAHVMFRSQYLKRVREARSVDPKMARGSHLLFQLCNELNIPIDKERFHYSYRS